MKNNQFPVKHNRLSSTFDFGEEWFCHPCSQTYWDEVMPIFEKLEGIKERHVLWSSVSRKEEDIYVPLLNAFVDEIDRIYHEDCSIPQQMVAYLLGKYDFDKVIGRVAEQELELPTKILNIELKDGSKNTIELDMNNGWAFTFRIYSSETYVVPSLKFDVQFLGLPIYLILTIYCQ